MLRKRLSTFSSSPSTIPTVVRSSLVRTVPKYTVLRSSLVRTVVNPSFLSTTTKTLSNEHHHHQPLHQPPTFIMDTYRRYGHHEALLDPLQLHQRPARKELDTVGRQATYDSLYGNRSYIGFEIDHIDSATEREFWYRIIEQGTFLQPLSYSEQRNTAILLTEGQTLEAFLEKKMPTLKRYSGEGCETLLPAVHTILTTLMQQNVQEVVIGQAHRGRLALLTSILKYSPKKLFWKLQGYNDIPDNVPGIDDVASHIYMSHVMKDPSNPLTTRMNITLLPNPSHLEAVNPVVTGKVRAKLDENINACGILIHGDAACSGQGIVAETYQLARLPGYSTKGTIHIITNNQLGFTSDHQSGRSSTYASDFAKIIGVPVLHVNAERPQEIIHACRTAVQYRQQFQQDVVIDIIGYRKYGHNEVDEPSFTNPLMYKQIRQQEPFAVRYGKEVLTDEGRDKLATKLNAYLETEYQVAMGKNAGKDTLVFTKETGSTGKGDGTLGSGTHIVGDGTAYNGKWKDMVVKGSPTNLSTPGNDAPTTGIPVPILQQIGKMSVQYPSTSFQLHDRLLRTHVQARLESIGLGSSKNGKEVTITMQRTIDWSTAEALAWGSLLQEGKSIRISGQDVQRGTFSHRHAVLVDQQNGNKYIPLNNMTKLPIPTDGQNSRTGKLHIYSSLLSEMAVLGYEYGYSLENPHNLVLWEAQFGDFANCAQTIIDTFIVSSETKWLRSTGLVMLLPHGYDGAGPEHSSARIERFLQLVNDQTWCGANYHPGTFAKEDKSVHEPENMSIVQPTTAANYFHVLRRQMVRTYRKPLIVVSPKALLRLPEAYSSLTDMAPGTLFQPVLDDASYVQHPEGKKHVERIILCSGKIYYELDKLRSTLEKEGKSMKVALVRIEELAPFPLNRVLDVVNSYPSKAEIMWAQDEPSNMGAWLYVQQYLQTVISQKYQRILYYIGRPALAAPAVGLGKLNKLQQDTLLKSVFHPLH